MNASPTKWVAVDWGTSNLRVWAIGADDKVTAKRASNCGMGGLRPEEFEPALLSLINDLLPVGQVTPIVVCGMAGAAQGWIEAPYNVTPCAPAAGGAASPVCADPRISVSIVAGVSQLNPADVMRGEETQIAGYLAGDPQFDGAICMPGTHSKWARIVSGAVVKFQTCMTGELFSLLSNKSVLRHTVNSEDWNADAFLAAASEALYHPQTVAGELFRLRAAALVSDLGPATARARLSGLLVGLELAASEPYWREYKVVLIGEKTLSTYYSEALVREGADVFAADGADFTLAGLKAAHAALKGNS